MAGRHDYGDSFVSHGIIDNYYFREGRIPKTRRADLEQNLSDTDSRSFNTIRSNFGDLHRPKSLAPVGEIVTDYEKGTVKVVSHMLLIVPAL